MLYKQLTIIVQNGYIGSDGVWEYDSISEWLRLKEDELKELSFLKSVVVSCVDGDIMSWDGARESECLVNTGVVLSSWGREREREREREEHYMYTLNKYSIFLTIGSWVLSGYSDHHINLCLSPHFHSHFNSLSFTYFICRRAEPNTHLWKNNDNNIELTQTVDDSTQFHVSASLHMYMYAHSI